MWLEIGTMIISTLLSIGGISVPNMSIAPNTTPAAYCAAQVGDSCLASDACDVFIAASGEETCAVACDMRDVASCSLDANCAVINGACDYRDDSPDGC